ncbi:hypothetical protein [Paraherbaspirillum soli]|uniref:Uncharacterized protein n=1 Tax=Paraherbaspirillum soli TaxID=631222 RepID=A0ABW0MCC8_9BURK
MNKITSSGGNQALEKRPSLAVRAVKNIKICLVILPIVFLGWASCSLLCWPVLLGLQKITDTFFIPYPSASYRSMNLLSHMGLLDFPRSFVGAFGVIFLNAPLGFLIMFWGIFCFCIAYNIVEAWRKLPKRNKALRSARQRELLLRTLKQFVVGTGVFFVLCIPFLRRYEVITADSICVKEFFDWHEQVYPLASLQRIQRVVTGKGLISWDLHFAGGPVYSTTAPDMQVLEQLLSRPGVASNVEVRGHQLYLRKE